MAGREVSGAWGMVAIVRSEVGEGVIIDDDGFTADVLDLFCEPVVFQLKLVLRLTIFHELRALVSDKYVPFDDKLQAFLIVVDRVSDSLLKSMYLEVQSVKEGPPDSL